MTGRICKALERVWGKISRTPRLPPSLPTGLEQDAFEQVLHDAAAKDFGKFAAAIVKREYAGTVKPEPPPTPARQSWDAYAAMMASHQSYPGWTFCKFGVRGPGKDDHADVQGIVRSSFGAWWAPFLCVDDALNFKTTRGLACIEHTPTGMAIGVFSDMDLAVEAAEIAMRMADWSDFDLDQAGSMELVRRVRSAWAAIGIGFHSRFEAVPMVSGKVPEGMPRVAIFMKAPIEQRPEMLS